MGELHVLSGSASSGYWRNPELTGRQFTSSEEGRWYRTGDLAVIHDQQLFIVGRESALAARERPIHLRRIAPRLPRVRLVDDEDVPLEVGDVLELVVLPAEVDGALQVLQAHELDEALGAAFLQAAQVLLAGEAVLPTL